jgi:hypothetical protein
MGDERFRREERLALLLAPLSAPLFCVFYIPMFTGLVVDRSVFPLVLAVSLGVACAACWTLGAILVFAFKSWARRPRGWSLIAASAAVGGLLPGIASCLLGPGDRSGALLSSSAFYALFGGSLGGVYVCLVKILRCTSRSR